MAGSINKVILVGHLGRDPEIRTMQNGNKLANLRLATSESWKDRNSGERQERTEWHSVVIFNEHLVDVAERFLTKGALVYIEGQLATRKWTDQQDVERYSTEVVLQRFRGDLQMLGARGAENPSGAQESGAGRSQDTGRGQGSGPVDLDEEIPFAPDR